MNFKKVKKDIEKQADIHRAESLMRFFKTGKGEYGEGDTFLGLVMGQQRMIAKQYKELSLSEIQKLLDSAYHEFRMVGLLILVYKYPKSTQTEQKNIYNFYLKNYQAINNWDLVDVTTPQIVGQYILERPKQRKVLYSLAKSNNLWKKRIAVLATYPMIKHKDFTDILKIAELLLTDEHDLIHKAVGWMLREVGKQDFKTEEMFIKKYCSQMPRTMLRYAIEKFPEDKRQLYMKK